MLGTGGPAGTTVFSGIMGYRRHGRIHRDRLFGMVDGEPATILRIDDEQRTVAALTVIVPMNMEAHVVVPDLDVASESDAVTLPWIACTPPCEARCGTLHFREVLTKSIRRITTCRIVANRPRVIRPTRQHPRRPMTPDDVPASANGGRNAASRKVGRSGVQAQFSRDSPVESDKRSTTVCDVR